MYPIQADEPTQPLAPIYQPAPAASPAPAPRPRVGQVISTIADRTSRAIWVLFGIVQALLILRIVLRLLAANPSAGFTSLVYGLTAPLVAPFTGVFPEIPIASGALELSALLAILVYALAARLLVRLVGIAR